MDELRRWVMTAALAAGQVIFPTTGRAEPSAGVEALRQGAPAVIRVNKAVGTLQRGGSYIVRIDQTKNRVAASDMRGGKLASYPFDMGQFDNGIQLWGAKFRWSGRAGCLVNAEGGDQRCTAEVSGPLVPDTFSGQKDIVATGAWRLTTHLSQHLSNPEAVVTRAAACPRLPELRQTHIASRALAESLRINGAVLPFITDEKSRAEAESLVDRAIAQLLATTPPTSRTTYTQCYGGIDLITPFLVVRALDMHQRFRPRAEVKAYLERLWPQLMSEGAIEANGARNARDTMGVANGYAAYLHVAAVMERHGIRAFQDFTWRGLDLLLNAQTNRSGQTCSDPKGNHAQPFGGWPHGTTDCSQNLGYHDFITGALIAVHGRMLETGQCRAAMADRCRRIEVSLAAALAWIGGLTSGERESPLLDRARGSSNIAERPGAGDVAAAQAGFRIIAHLGRDPDDVRPILVGALDRTIRARPGLIPIGTYLRSNITYNP